MWKHFIFISFCIILRESVIKTRGYQNRDEVHVLDSGQFENFSLRYFESGGGYRKILHIILVLFWAIVPESFIKSRGHAHRKRDLFLIGQIHFMSKIPVHPHFKGEVRHSLCATS